MSTIKFLRDFRPRFSAFETASRQLEFPLDCCYRLGMEIKFTIPDDVIARVESLGLSPETYFQDLIAQQIPAPEPQMSREERRARMERFLEEMASHSDKIPILRDEALTRESFYSDRD